MPVLSRWVCFTAFFLHDAPSCCTECKLADDMGAGSGARVCVTSAGKKTKNKKNKNQNLFSETKLLWEESGTTFCWGGRGGANWGHCKPARLQGDACALRHAGREGEGGEDDLSFWELSQRLTPLSRRPMFRFRFSSSACPQQPVPCSRQPAIAAATSKQQPLEPR